jgi:ABC-type transporter Mla subunit MlaD
MELVADVLLAAGAFGAAAYCLVLSRRLSKFTRLESGMGGAIAVLSAQVDDLTRALGAAQDTARGSTERLAELTARAEAAASRIDVLLASLHDLPDSAEHAPEADAAERRLRFVRRRGSRGEDG